MIHFRSRGSNLHPVHIIHL